MRRFIRFIWFYLLGILGILMISAAPALFQSDHLIDVSMYTKQLVELLGLIVQPQEWVYHYLGRELSIFSFLWDPYTYSLRIFLGALLLGGTIAFLLAVVTMFLPNVIKQIVKRILGIMEAIPDLMVAFFIQMIVVAIFERTGLLVMQFVTLGEERIYMAPIVVLSFLPMISLYRIMVLLMEEEQTKSYVELARSKGLRENFIVIKHIIRNIIKSVFYQSKLIIWATLSSLFVIEYAFNINGISNLIMQDFRPIVLTFALIMIFTPLFFIYQGMEIFVFKEGFTSTVIQRKQTNSPKQTMKSNEKSHARGRFFSGVDIRNYLSSVISGLWQHLKNPKFVIGFIFVVGMVIVSIMHTWLQDNPVQQYVLVYDDTGNLISSKPHPPSEHVPMGSDYLGYSIKDQLLAGAKYTILFAFAVACLRLVFGFLLAIPYVFWLNHKWRRGIEKLVDGFHYLPLTVIAIVLLSSYLQGSVNGFTHSFTERIVVQGFILTILVVPLVSVLIGNEIRLILNQEFITGAKVLGASRKQQLQRHIMPHLSAKLGIIFGQQFIQVLILMIHLGLFELFLGGTSVMYDQFYKAPPHSVTFEWSGLISNTREAFMVGHYWIVIPVFIAFMLVIIAMQLIIEGIQEVQQARVGVKKKQSWNRKHPNQLQDQLNIGSQVHPDQFQFGKKNN